MTRFPLCGSLPPDELAHALEGGSPCPLPRDAHVEHQTTTPDGRTWIWNAFDCAYPEDCAYDDDGCCVTYGELAP